MSWAVVAGLDYINNRTTEQKVLDEAKRRVDIGDAGCFIEDHLELESTVYYIERCKGDSCSFESVRLNGLCFTDYDVAVELCEKANNDLKARNEHLRFGPYGGYWSVLNQKIFKKKEELWRIAEKHTGY